LLAWIIILAVLLLLLTLPVGIDAAYAGSFTLKLKISLFRVCLFPKKTKKKKKEPKKTEAEQKPSDGKQKTKRTKLSLDDILTLLDIVLKALRRFRIHLSIDLFRLIWEAAASDPYDAVIQYGRVNAVIGNVRPAAHKTFKIRDEEIRTTLSLESERPVIETRIILSIQIWEILMIALLAGGAALKWYISRKRAARRQTAGGLRKEHI